MKRWDTVVVGVDGSEGSRRALAWAADEAREHQARLRVVTTWTPPPVAAGAGYASLPWYGEADLSQIAERQQTDAVTEVLGEKPDLQIERVVDEGHAAPHLIKASAGADLLVVGCRGHGGFAGMLLGSVSQHVAAHAECPVVIVR